ncbi:MAG TPA: hypothetical protein VMV03_12650 [Spirochaetia bacterium]|nr:hypothetical protein [Spirochaetia bacterium]
MVDFLRRTFIIAAAACALASCDFMGVTPFPGFVDKTDLAVDLGSRIDSISNGASSVTFDLNVVKDPSASQQHRVLLLVEPQSGAGSFSYTGQEIVMDQNLAVLGQAKTATSLDYFSKPYAYAHNGNILIGYALITPQGQPGSQTLSATGLEGFAFTDGTDTYVFATPSGSYTSFDLSWIDYLPGWGYSLNSPGTLSIIPAAMRPSTSDPNYANLGYQLIGLSYNASSAELTFVLSQPAQGTILARRIPLATAITPGAVLMPTGAADVSLESDRPYVSSDIGGLFLVRREGWMDRYPWTQTGALSFVGSKTEIVGDRSLSRKYAFLETGSPPSYMYRFDPSSRILTRYRRWW